MGSTFHSLPFTFATALFARVEHPEIVQSLAPRALFYHAEIDTYSHLMDSMGGLDEAFDQ